MAVLIDFHIWLMLVLGVLAIIFVLATVEAIQVGRSPFKNFLLWLQYLLG
jgi:hypothetical protein